MSKTSESSGPRRSGPRQPRYERLTAWQACHDLTLAVFRESVGWQKEHQDTLADELRKSLTAAVTHIMIGADETDEKGFRRELNLSLGKLARFESTWEVVKETGLVTPEAWGEIEAKRDHAEHLVRGLYYAIGRKGGGATSRARGEGREARGER